MSRPSVTAAARPPVSPVVLIRGAGEMASAVAWRLHRAHHEGPRAHQIVLHFLRQLGQHFRCQIKLVRQPFRPRHGRHVDLVLDTRFSYLK